MKLSKRLQAIADWIPDHKKVIDVGCDHALLDIYLSLEKNCDCLATDIREGALQQAKNNILKYGAKTVETMLTDGLNRISVEPSNLIVISGMGTSTIQHILENQSLSDELIISTQTDWEELRRYMVSLGYRIQDENYVEEKKKEYVVMKFHRGDACYTEEDYQFGPYLKRNILYLHSKKKKIQSILEKIPKEDLEYQRQLEIFKKLDSLESRIV